MPTYDFNLTRNEIIQRAYRIIGILGAGQPLTGDQLNHGATALNSMVKHWQNDHIHLWTLTNSTIALSQGTDNYSLASANLIGIDMAWLRINSVDFKLKQISWREFSEIDNKANFEAQPECFALNGAISSSLYVYPTPNQAYTLHYVMVKKLADFDAGTDNPDFAPKWLEALSYGLAANLADEFGIPLSERSYITAKAEEFKRVARAGDWEGSDEQFIKGLY